MDFKDFEKIKENYILNMNELIKIISPLDSSTFLDEKSIEVNLLISKLQNTLGSIKPFIENKEIIDNIRKIIIDLLNAYDTLKSNRDMRDIYHLDVLKEVLNTLMSYNAHLTFDDDFSKIKKPKKDKIIENKKTALEDFFWSRIHPEIVSVSKKLFENGHNSEAVFSALKEVNLRVKKIVKNKVRIELDGKSLMFKAFDIDKPIIQLSDCSDETERDIQEGYKFIFGGVMLGIRNPKAHENVTIDENRAIHFLYLASLLMYKLDESK